MPLKDLPTSLPFPCDNPQLSSLKCQSILTRAFSPHVAVYSSADTDELIRSLGFSSFRSLLRPFGDKISGRVTIRDSQGSTNTYDDFSVHFTGPPSQKSSSADTPKSPSISASTLAAGTSNNFLNANVISTHSRGRSIDSLFPRNVNQAMALYDSNALEEHISKFWQQVNHIPMCLQAFSKTSDGNSNYSFRIIQSPCSRCNSYFFPE